MATQPERINMAEGPAPELPAPPVSAGALPERKSPIRVASNFDLNRRDYQTRIIGNYVSWVDPQTGAEVARMPKVEGEAIPVPELELDPEGKEKKPDDIVDILLTISNMDAETRETHKDQFQKAVDILKTYTDDKKLLDLDWDISKELVALRKEDQKAIDLAEQADPVNPGQGARFQELLDKLDRAERDLKNYNRTLADESNKGLISEEEWADFQKQQGTLTTDRVSLRQQITDIPNRVNTSFLSDRDSQKAPIDEKREKLIETRLKERRIEGEERLTKPNTVESALEGRLFIDIEPGTVPRKETFADQLKFYEDQLGLKRKGNANNLAEAEVGLSSYFHEARSLGLVNDLEGILEREYTKWADSMLLHQVLTQQDQMQVAPGKSYFEVETEVIAYTKALLNPDKAEYIEDEIRWDKFERKGLDPAVRQAMQGIRVAFMKRAQAQALDSLENTPINRLSGGWDVHRLDRDIKRRRGRQEAAAAGEPLYKRESYYKVTLLGRNRQEIELGADQCAENIMKSINDFDIGAIQTRTQALVEEIQRKKTLIHALEGGSEDSAQAKVDQITDSVTNKIDFHILEWAGQNLQMDFFADYLAKQMRVRGADKIRTIPAMHEGLEGIAIHFLLDPRFRLHHRPQGWKGQMKDEDTTHKFLRGNIEGKVAKLVMEYELKGQDDVEKSFYRERLTQVNSWHDFSENFQHKGFIPKNNKYLTYEQYVAAQDQSTLLEVPAPDSDNPREYDPLNFKEVKDPNTGNKIRYKILTLDEYLKIEKYLTPAQRKSYREDYHGYKSEVVRKKGKDADSADLDALREAREALDTESKDYQKALDRATSAVTTAKQVLDIFGESAEMGDPSIVMKESKDYISIREFTLVCKYAILQADQGLVTDVQGRQYRVRLNNMNTAFALIRDRSNEWLRRATRAGEGYDRSKASRDFVIDFLDDEKNGLKLVNGSKQTGLTESDWQTFKRLYRKFREKDHQTKIEDVGSVPFGKTGLTESDWQTFKNAANKLKSNGYKVETTVQLAAGFEETGFTQSQWQAFKDAVANLNKNGFRASIGGVKFADIIKMKNLKPLKNNFLADYKSSMSQINSEEVREQVAKGNLPIIKNILVRLGFKDRQTEGGTTQQEIDQYTQIIEDSRSFDAEVESMSYYAATHPSIDRTGDGSYPVFNPDGIDYGFQGMNWGMKRLRHWRAFLYVNLNRTVPRGIDLVHTMPTLDRLAGEMDFDNILDLALNINTSANGMESVDTPALFQYANRIKTMAYLRGRGEGGISEGQGGLDKGWGWFEKWLTDANGLWKEIVKQTGRSMDYVKLKLANPFTIGEDEAEIYVDASMKVLGRFQPLLTGNEKSLAEDRQALSAGSGYEDNQKKIFRFSEWLRSEKGGSGRDQGGLVVQKEIANIIKLFMQPGSFAPGRTERVVDGKQLTVLSESPSIWEEAMRKLTPSHNPRLLSRVLPLNYEILST